MRWSSILTPARPLARTFKGHVSGAMACSEVFPLGASFCRTASQAWHRQVRQVPQSSAVMARDACLLRMVSPGSGASCWVPVDFLFKGTCKWNVPQFESRCGGGGGAPARINPPPPPTCLLILPFNHIEISKFVDSGSSKLGQTQRPQSGRLACFLVAFERGTLFSHPPNLFFQPFPGFSTLHPFYLTLPPFF